jgi:hypothetical protein
MFGIERPNGIRRFLTIVGIYRSYKLIQYYITRFPPTQNATIGPKLQSIKGARLESFLARLHITSPSRGWLPSQLFGPSSSSTFTLECHSLVRRSPPAMKIPSLALLILGHAVQGSLVRRVANTFTDSECSPNVTDLAGTAIPPCISIRTIESVCQPNGTQPADFLASAQCMCSPPSSFFNDWIACRNCLFLHGGLNRLVLNQVSVIIQAASTSLCTGTPTAAFAAIYSSAQTAGAAVTSGATTYVDQYPGNPAVGLYYTPTGPQGPGVVGGTLSDDSNPSADKIL